MPLLTVEDLPPPPPGRTGWPWTEGSPLQVSNAIAESIPRISVVTPSFNQAAYLEETIRSVLLQGYPDLEYIVMDGGSQDGSVDIIRKYSAWLAHWTSEPDEGQSDAINKGWARATGEIVTWLNSDDAYRPGALASAVDVLVRNPSVGLVYGRSAVFDGEGRLTGRTYGRPFVIDEFTEGRCPIPQPSAFIRRSALDAAGLLDPSLHFAMDADLWLRLAAVAEVRFMDQVWSNFRYYPDSKSGQGRLRFETDTYELVRRSFERSLLPAHLADERDFILARLLARIAMAHYRKADDGNSRTYAARALRRDPRILRDARLRADIVRCLLGRQWVMRLKSVRPARA